VQTIPTRPKKAGLVAHDLAFALFVAGMREQRRRPLRELRVRDVVHSRQARHPGHARFAAFVSGHAGRRGMT